MMNRRRITQLLSLIVVFLMISAVSLRRDGRWLGHSIKEEKTTTHSSNDTLRTEKDGTQVINTTYLAKDIIGFGGVVPLEIYVKDGTIVRVRPLHNEETPEFFGRASSLLSKWKGQTLDAADSMKVDAVSGATYSSKAIIGNMKRGIAFAKKSTAGNNTFSLKNLEAKTLVGILVALLAAIVPLFYKNKVYRVVQQLLNVAVLGFWCGSFINYTSLISFTSNGLHPLAMPLTTLLVVVAFIYPLLGKKSYYCTNVCPFGSIQELANRCIPYQVKIGVKTVKRLDRFRKVLWALLMLCLWTGVWFSWIDWEPFSAFIFQSASWGAIVVAIIFLLLSTVIKRPYCRFVCPTGTLLKLSQGAKIP
jgi:NosR/NirI family nitrous oxide reductase transcriptional regulator